MRRADSPPSPLGLPTDRGGGAPMRLPFFSPEDRVACGPEVSGNRLRSGARSGYGRHVKARGAGCPSAVFDQRPPIAAHACALRQRSDRQHRVPWDLEWPTRQVTPTRSSESGCTADSLISCFAEKSIRSLTTLAGIGSFAKLLQITCSPLASSDTRTSHLQLGRYQNNKHVNATGLP